MIDNEIRDSFNVSGVPIFIADIGEGFEGAGEVVGDDVDDGTWDTVEFEGYGCGGFKLETRGGGEEVFIAGVEAVGESVVLNSCAQYREDVFYFCAIVVLAMIEA